MFRMYHDDVIKWKHFPRYWPLCGEFTDRRWIPHTKASDAELWWCFSLICTWINRWVNNREAGDLRRHRAHYDVIVMATVRRDSLYFMNLFQQCETGWHTLLHELYTIKQICNLRPCLNDISLHSYFILKYIAKCILAAGLTSDSFEVKSW